MRFSAINGQAIRDMFADEKRLLIRNWNNEKKKQPENVALYTETLVSRIVDESSTIAFGTLCTGTRFFCNPLDFSDNLSIHPNPEASFVEWMYLRFSSMYIKGGFIF